MLELKPQVDTKPRDRKSVFFSHVKCMVGFWVSRTAALPAIQGPRLFPSYPGATVLFSPGQQKEKGRKVHIWQVYYAPVLEGKHIAFVHLELKRTWSHDHT